MLLLREEAEELRAALDDLLKKSDFAQHHHVNESSYERECTIALYKADDVSGFDPRMQKLIRDGN